MDRKPDAAELSELSGRIILVTDRVANLVAEEHLVGIDFSFQVERRLNLSVAIEENCQAIKIYGFLSWKKTLNKNFASYVADGVLKELCPC